MRNSWSWSTCGGFFLGKSHAEIQEICRAAGLAGIEGSAELFDGCSDAELERIGASYQEAGREIATFHLPFTAPDDLASFYETTRRQAAEKARRWMERAALLGARVGIQHPSTSRCSVDVEGLGNYLRQLGRSLEALLPVAESLGFTIALENMLPAEGGRFGSRPEHFERFLREFAHSRLGFCLDTGHALVAGGGPDGADAIFAAMSPRIVAFHLADNAGDRDSHLAPGHGLVDWQRVFQRAAQLGYTGGMCIETPPFAPGPNYAREAWRQMVADTEALAERALAD